MKRGEALAKAIRESFPLTHAAAAPAISAWPKHADASAASQIIPSANEISAA
jgi:hypothetical protein